MSEKKDSVENDDLERDLDREGAEEGASEEEPTKGDSSQSEGSKNDSPEKSLKDAQLALEQKSKELAELKERLAKLEGYIAAIKREEEPAPEDGERLFSFFEDKALKETLLDDPENIVNMFKRAFADTLKLLDARDRALREMIREQSPEIVALKDRIAELAKDPDYQGFTRDQLAIIAKKQAAAEGGGRVVRPGPGGRRVSGSVAKTDLERLTDDYIKRIYGEE